MENNQTDDINEKMYQTFKVFELGWFYNYVYPKVINSEGDTIYVLYEKILDNFNPDNISTDDNFIKATVVEINDMFDLSIDESIVFIKRFYLELQEMLRELTAKEGMALIESILSNTSDSNEKCGEDFMINKDDGKIMTHLDYINNVVMADIRKNGLRELKSGKILIPPKYDE